MKRLLKYTALIATVLVICSSAWANTYLDHINTAPNNKGDMMIFPWFLALDGGWQTKLTVINTDQVNSVVAKVVFRSFKNSQEMLDFLIFLSPADVWTGKVYYNTTSKTVKVFSDDDSILTNLTTFASPADPVDQPLFTSTLCADDGDFLGYVEVIESGYALVAPGHPGVLKSAILAAYKSGLTMPGLNVLAGFMDVGNNVLGLSTTYQATNFRDYGNQIALTTADETKIGTGAKNNVAEIEASMTKDFIGLPYVNNANDVALHFFTFPTKQTSYTSCASVTTSSPYFKQNSDSKTCILYDLVTYDLKENSPTSGSPFSGGSTIPQLFCNEVNFLSSADFPFAEGWGYYSFNDNTLTSDKATEPLQYKGTPVIPTYLYIGASGLSGAYGAWTNSPVYDTLGTPVDPADVLIDYQYTDGLAGLRN